MEMNRPSVSWFIESQSEWFLRNGIPDWFHGVITRKDAEDLLKDKPAGCFLIRVGESRIGYSLSYKSVDRYRHFMIDVLKDQECNLSGDTRSHRTLEDLVRFHMQHPLLPYNEILTEPCGQKTQSEADYHELFELTNFAKTKSTENNIPSTALEPAHDFMRPVVPPITHINQECPPLPPRAIPSDCAFNLPSPVFQTPDGARLYPVLPHEMPHLFTSTGQVRVMPSQQAHGHKLTKTVSVDSLNIPNTSGRPKSLSIDYIASINNQHSGNGEQNQGKPIKACRNFMTRAAALVTDGQIALDFKSMEHTLATRLKNINIGKGPEEKQSVSPNMKPKKWVPEEYKTPPPFAPGFC